MVEYVCEAGETALCAVGTGEGCSEKELKFTDTWRAKMADDPSVVGAELARLSKMKSAGKMKPELQEWLSQRVGILKQLAKAEGAAGSKDEL